jgi:hypothetical protein
LQAKGFRLRQLLAGVAESAPVANTPAVTARLPTNSGPTSLNPKGLRRIYKRT